MIKLFIWFIFICLWIDVIGQPKTKVIIIDSLITKGMQFSVSQTEENFLFFPLPLDSTNCKIFSNTNPALICEVSILNDSAVAWLQLDNEGGFIELQNLYNLKSDTIRIEKVEMWKNCLNDTTFTQIAYWKDTDTGVIDPPFKINNSTKIHRKDCKSYVPNIISVVINGVEYTPPVKIIQFPLVSETATFQGRKPRAYQKKRERYKGKKKVYFHGQSNRYISIYSSTINLSEK